MRGNEAVDNGAGLCGYLDIIFIMLCRSRQGGKGRGPGGSVQEVVAWLGESGRTVACACAMKRVSKVSRE